MKRALVIAMVAGVLATAGPALAYSTMTLQFDRVDPRVTVPIVIGNQPDGTSYSGNVYAGVYNWVQLAPSEDAGLKWEAFCIDAQEVVSGDVVEFQVNYLEDAPLPAGGMGQAKADLLQKLWAYVGDPLAMSGNPANFDDAQQAAAMQLAIWEIVFETGGTLDVSSGPGFSANNATLTNLANSWLSGAAQYEGQAPVFALVSTTHQDQAVLLGSSFATPVPFPPAALAGVVLMGGIGGWARLRRKPASL